jgi:hypothetical protein
VLQISEQEAALAVTREERARAYVEMADVWRRHLGDPEQAELFYARARAEGWSDARAAPANGCAGRTADAGRRTGTARTESARTSPRAAVRRDEFEFYDDLEVDSRSMRRGRRPTSRRARLHRRSAHDARVRDGRHGRARAERRRHRAER